jgi:hypothetical protein
MSELTEGVNCANCGNGRSGAYCAECGQNDRIYQRALPPLVWDLLRETFELDSRLFSTLQHLLFKPGSLAVEFSLNRRASYVSPFRLYLFTSLLFFFLVSVTNDFDTVYEEESVAIEREDVVQSDNSEYLFQSVDEARHEKLQEILDGPADSIGRNLLLGIAEQVAEQHAESVAAGGAEAKERWQPDPILRYMIGQLIDAVDDPRRLLGSLLDNLPVASFFMLPFFALLLSLLYRRNRRYFIENLVFATHLHSFAFIIFGITLFLPEDSDFASLLILLLGVYHFAALKRYYQESFRRTTAKFVLQVLVYFVFLVPTAFGMLAVFTLATV